MFFLKIKTKKNTEFLGLKLNVCIADLFLKHFKIMDALSILKPFQSI